MKTVELTLSKNKKPRQILKTFSDKKLMRGDRLRIKKKDKDISYDTALVLILILVIWYFSKTGFGLAPKFVSPRRW